MPKFEVNVWIQVEAEDDESAIERVNTLLNTISPEYGKFDYMMEDIGEIVED